MIVWVIYDISENRTRKNVSKICKNFGLYRVQKSTFCGELNTNRVDELEMSVESEIDVNTDSVFIFPVCESDFHKTRLLGEGFDRELIAKTKTTHFI